MGALQDDTSKSSFAPKGEEMGETTPEGTTQAGQDMEGEIIPPLPEGICLTNILTNIDESYHRSPLTSLVIFHEGRRVHKGWVPNKVIYEAVRPYLKSEVNQSGD